MKKLLFLLLGAVTCFGCSKDSATEVGGMPAAGNAKTVEKQVSAEAELTPVRIIANGFEICSSNQVQITYTDENWEAHTINLSQCSGEGKLFYASGEMLSVEGCLSVGNARKMTIKVRGDLAQGDTDGEGHSYDHISESGEECCTSFAMPIKKPFGDEYVLRLTLEAQY